MDKVTRLRIYIYNELGVTISDTEAEDIISICSTENPGNPVSTNKKTDNEYKDDINRILFFGKI